MDEDDDVNFVLDNIFDVIFLIDIFINFFTAYVGPEDNVIKNRGVRIFLRRKLQLIILKAGFLLML